MGVYNINKIESWYNEFSSLRNNYVNNYYKNYNNSYIKRCNDSNVAKMRNKLNAHYEKIKKLYDGINKYWREYLNDVKNTDNRLAGKGGGINAASLASKLNSMPRLKEYNDGSYTIVMKTNNFFNKYSYDIESILDSFKNEVETGAIFTRTSATVTVFTASCAEGIIKLVEMAADGVVILGTIAITKYALYADVYNHIIGRESNYTKELWDKTRAHVSKDYTKTAFDLFYDNTGAGRWLKNNAYGFDTVREIGCEVGEVVGVVALSAVTGGSAAVIYGAAKGVEHTEENWQDSETSTFAGLVKGGLQGAADGAFFALGAKGDQVMKNVAKNAVEQGGKTALKKAGILTGKMGFEVGCSLVQDCSNIFINAYFKEGNLGDNLKYYYDQAGGSKQLLISASTAMILSGISDAVDLKKINQTEKVSKIINNVDKNITSKQINDDLSKMSKLSKTITGLFASIPATFSKMKNVDIPEDSRIFKKIQLEGLYHFTDDVSAKKILDSGYIKESSMFTSYGKKRTFLFAGIPSIEDTCINGVFDYKKVAVKLHPSDMEIGKLQYRKYSDAAISSLGNYYINKSSPEIVYLVLKQQDGVLKYVEVPKIEFDNYNPHFSENVIDKTIQKARKKIYQFTVGMSSETDNVIKGLKTYTNDFNTKRYKVNKILTNDIENSDGVSKFIKNVSNLDGTIKKSDINNNIIVKHSSSSSYLKSENKWLLKNFDKLSDSQKIDFIQNSNSNKLKYIFNDTSSVKKYKTLIDEKIIKNQGSLINKSYFEYLLDKNHLKVIEYISEDPSVLKKISDENLIILFSRGKLSQNKKINLKNIVNELETRIKVGDFSFNNRDIITSPGFGMKFSSYEMMINAIDDDTRNILLNNMKQTAEKLPKELKDINYGEMGLFKRVGIVELYENGRLDENSIKMINKILENNRNGMTKFNIQLLDKDIVKNFDYNTLNQIGNDVNMSKKLVDLYQNDRKLFDSFVEIMNKSSKDNSLNTFYIKSKSCLNYLSENSEILSNVDKSILTDDNFINYILYNQNSYSLYNPKSKKISLDYTKNYNKEFSLLCDNMFHKGVESSNLKQIKEAYFQKYYSISSDEVKYFISKYGDHLDEIIKYDTDGTVTTVIGMLKKIDESSDIDYIKKIYDNQKFNFNSEEMICIDSKIKEVYSKSYVEALSSTQKNINAMISSSDMHKIIDYNGKKISIVDCNDKFNFLVHSSDTGFTMDKELINGSYVDTWKSISPETHALSTSYITESNIGSAPVKNKGVLYGFTNINASDIGIISPYDLNSNIADYGFSSGNKQIFISADEISNNTYRVYNEIVLDRQSVKPSCVIIYTDMSSENVNAAIKAASEWDIPIVRINKVQLANNQLQQVKKLVGDFRMNGNIESLQKAIDKYESNVSGYKLNASVQNGNEDFTSSIDNSIVSDLFKSSDMENLLLNTIDEMNDKNEINQVINILENVKSKYEIVNNNGTSAITNTKESFDIDTLIKLAKEKMSEV